MKENSVNESVVTANAKSHSTKFDKMEIIVEKSPRIGLSCHDVLQGHQLALAFPFPFSGVMLSASRLSSSTRLS